MIKKEKKLRVQSSILLNNKNHLTPIKYLSSQHSMFSCIHMLHAATDKLKKKIYNQLGDIYLFLWRGSCFSGDQAIYVQPGSSMFSVILSEQLRYLFTSRFLAKAYKIIDVLQIGQNIILHTDPTTRDTKIE